MNRRQSCACRVSPPRDDSIWRKNDTNAQDWAAQSPRKSSNRRILCRWKNNIIPVRFDIAPIWSLAAMTSTTRNITYSAVIVHERMQQEMRWVHGWASMLLHSAWNTEMDWLTHLHNLHSSSEWIAVTVSVTRWYSRPKIHFVQLKFSSFVQSTGR